MVRSIRVDYARGSAVIEAELEKAFNFISRGAQHERWHFDDHLGAVAKDVEEGGVVSAFSIEEPIGAST